MKNIKLLECTLRDGTYVVDFMINVDTFYRFTEGLIRLGFSEIEVGHGLGLGAYRTYSAGFSDEELWKKLEPLTSQSHLHSFYIPYVGEPADFSMARDHGLYGLRVGMEPVFVKKYYPVLEKAKKQGLFVSINLMKSYTVTPDALARIAEMIKDVVDVVYIVDSAGYMLPAELRHYVEAIYDRLGLITLGYHGHNNLNLAVANALELIDLGVRYIDTTLTGIGRGGGNAPTETMIAVLAKKFGNDFFTDELLLETLKLANEFREYIYSKGKTIEIRSDDILFGYAGFHSSYEAEVRKYTERMGLDFHQSIINLCRKERTLVNDEILNRILGKGLS